MPPRYVLGPNVTVNGNTTVANTVTCPEDTIAINGGVIVPNPPGDADLVIRESQPASATNTQAWFTRVFLEPPASRSVTLQWFAVCAPTGDDEERGTLMSATSLASLPALAPARGSAPASPLITGAAIG